MAAAPRRTPAAAAATDGTTATADSGSAAAGSTIKGNAFSPKELTAPAGSISITNEDGATHTVTADEGAFDVSIDGGNDASITVDGQVPTRSTARSTAR